METKHDFRYITYLQALAAKAKNLPTETFKVGDKCHYAFNGDYYPCTVTRVTATRVYCDGEGRTFTLRKNGTFRSLGGSGTWVLHHGHRDERNPSF